LKFLLDSSVYFAILLEKDFGVRAQPALRRMAPLMYLSSVVRAELTQGARGEVGRRLVARLSRSLERTGRVVAPSHQDWTEAGVIQSRIWDANPRLRTKSLLHDLLIARSARGVGACVVTGNVSDFELIREWLPIEVLDAAELLVAS
jgi:predicted nucleic acid-binding protein